jgi:hypothetical protein
MTESLYKAIQLRGICTVNNEFVNENGTAVVGTFTKEHWPQWWEIANFFFIKMLLAAHIWMNMFLC